MTLKIAITAFLVLWAASMAEAQKTPKLPNPSIDMKGYLRLANKAADHREKRRLTEDEFLKMSERPDVIILDARSSEKYEERHVKGAVNLSFPDITAESLARVLPNKNVAILIYCNNNFRNAEDAFPRKMATASLNLSTYIALYTYGYRNIYELEPLLDAKTTKLTLVSSRATASN